MARTLTHAVAHAAAIALVVIATLLCAVSPRQALADTQPAGATDLATASVDLEAAATPSSAELSDDGVDYGWLYRKGNYWYRVAQYPKTEPASLYLAFGTDGKYVWDKSNIFNYPGTNKVLVDEVFYYDGTLVYQRGPHVRFESVVNGGWTGPWGGNPNSIIYDDHVWRSRTQTARFQSFVNQGVYPHIAVAHNRRYDLKEIKRVEFDETLDNIWGVGHLGPKAVWRSDDDRLVYLDRWFEGCINLKSVTGFEHIYTGEVLDMSALFKDCYSLEELDLSSLDTRACQNFKGMFDGCASLVTLKTGENWSQAGVDSTSSTEAGERGKATFPLDMYRLVDGQKIVYKKGEVIPDGAAEYTVASRVNIKSASVLFADTASGSPTAFSERATYEYTGRAIVPAVKLLVGDVQLVEGTDYKLSYSKNVGDGTGRVAITGLGAYYGYTVADFTIQDTAAYAHLFDDGTLLLKANHHPASASVPSGLRFVKSWRWFEAQSAAPGSTVPWSSLADQVKQVVFDPSFSQFAPVTAARWFAGCTALEDVSGLQYLNTRSLASMAEMFRGCTTLESLPLAHLDFSHTRDLKGFFQDCTSLASASLVGCDFVCAEDLSAFFQGCTALKIASLPFDRMPRARSLNGLFRGCSSLSDVSLAGMSLPAAVDLSGFFEGCTSLTAVSLANASLPSAVDLGGFFKGCTSLVGVSLANANLPSAVNLSGFFKGCTSLVGVSLANANLSAVVDLSGFFEGCTSLAGVSLARANLPAAVDLSGFFSGCTSLTTASLASANLPAAEDLSGFFEGCTSLTTASLAGASLQSAVNLSGLFSGCISLTTASLAGASLPAAEDLSGFFEGCTSLTSVSLAGVTLPAAEDLNGFFQGCTALRDVNTSKVTLAEARDFSDFFKNCSSLESLDLSGLSAPKATNLSGFFSGCNAIETLSLGGIASDGAADVSALLVPCPKLATLKTAEAWRNAKADASRLKLGASAYRMSPSYARMEAGADVPDGAGEYRFGDVAMQFATVFMESSTYTCTGEALKPPVKVMLGDLQLQEGRDFELSYKNNVHPGKATVTVSGKGRFSGGLVVPFEIVARTTQVGDRLVYETDEVIYTVEVTKKRKSGGKSESVVAKLVGVTVKATQLRTMSIPDTCTVGGVKVTITEVSAKLVGQFRGVQNIYIGPKVVKIGACAFAKAKKVTKLFIKSARLKSVKNCLKKSKVKSVETRVYLSKSKKKTYRKWFTKKAGKKGVKFIYGIYATLV